MKSTRLLLALACALPFVFGATSSDARPGQALTPPEAKGVSLDGVPDEAAWEQAARLPVAAVEVPTPEGKQQLAPDVRVLSADGRLVIAVTCAEDPGTSMGLHLMCAPEGAKSAADAVSIDFRPVDPRAPKFHALGPKGVGRGHYRVEGAADWKRAGMWSLELGVPWTDLVQAQDQPLRLAVVVYTRTPNVLSTWPAGALWRAPAQWNELTPPAAGWPLDVAVDAKRIAREDAQDAAHMAAWLDFQRGAQTPILPTLPRDDVLIKLEENIVVPLQEVRRHRTDLRVPVDCLLGDAYHRMGLWRRAVECYSQAAEAAPGWREAHYGLFVKLLGQRMAAGAPGGPSDYARARRVLEESKLARDPSPWAQDGVRLARALLHYKQGEFAAALPVLEALAKRYPFDPFLAAHARFAADGRRAAGAEALRAKREEDLVRPKAAIETTRGTVVIELLPEDAPNTVKNFVYLAQKKFYDDLAIHRTVPYFLVQTGDPHTRGGAQEPGATGTGTPGYAIRSEHNSRRMLRGAVVMASAGQDTEGSQFYVLTGSAMHLQGEQTVFGRVLRGQDIVEGLAHGDRIVKITLRDLDPKARYVPITVAGREP